MLLLIRDFFLVTAPAGTAWWDCQWAQVQISDRLGPLGAAFCPQCTDPKGSRRGKALFRRTIGPWVDLLWGRRARNWNRMGVEGRLLARLLSRGTRRNKGALAPTRHLFVSKDRSSAFYEEDLERKGCGLQRAPQSSWRWRLCRGGWKVRVCQPLLSA